MFFGLWYLSVVKGKQSTSALTFGSNNSLRNPNFDTGGKSKESISALNVFKKGNQSA